MADDDFEGMGGLTDEDLSLPKATVAKLIQEMMPADITCAKETRDVLADCCVANEICEKEAKKTIAGEHVIGALKTLGFEEYIPEITSVFNDHQAQMKDREKRASKLDKSGLSEEELLRMQEQIFAQARANYEKQQEGS
ncbi:negative cofactor 2 transcription regulator complex subunit ncb2 [Quaeritorhiza haematococci]|nr:negative cofactor 2 transcription regulator complex subunit ncb2 [Quaeritorhiza haematococci]